MTRLALVAAVLIVLAGAWLTGSGRAQEPVPISVAAPLSSDELRELTYPNDFTASGFASLSDGSYREVAAPGSAAFIDVRLQRSAFGELNGAPAAAVVLATAGGGSGTFFDLHVIVRDGDGAPTVAAQRALGDRIRLQDLRFAAGLVRVDFTGFAPSDPLCCPTLNVVHGFALVDGTLQLVRGQEAPALLLVPAGASLVGWYGAPTTSTAILGSAGLVDIVWGFDTAEGWRVDSRDLPAGLRTPIAIQRGTGLFLVTRDALDLPVPLLAAPSACPLNPGPPNPVDPSMIVHQPGQGQRASGALRIEGLARVFEATVQLRIVDDIGAILADTFTTATAGGPELGAFDVTLSVRVEAETAVCVQVFEESARDGAAVNVVQIGVTLLPLE